MLTRRLSNLKHKSYSNCLQGVQNISIRSASSNRNIAEWFVKVQKFTPTENSIFNKYKASFLRSNIVQTCSKSVTAIQAKFSSEENRNAVSNNNFLQRYKFALAAATVSTTATTTPSNVVTDSIPAPPPVPPVTDEVETVVTEAVNQLNALGEPTFASLGLGGYTPVGIVQSCFEYLHVTMGIPWWEAIALATLFIRLCMFPLVIIAQRNAAKMNNYLPQLQAIQLKMTEARQTGNQLEAARLSQEMVLFMKEKNLNPLKNMVVPLAQMPVFISFFISLRQMANLPVGSLTTGGLWWFTDLTVPDQFFLLPLITSTTLYLTIELGTDSAKLSSQNMQTMKYVLRALPVVIFPFIMNFPGAILCYWVSSNFISLAQVGILKIPSVRDYFKIEPLVTHRPENLPIKPKGFTEGIKDSWTNIKISKELEERRRLDEIQFQRAGRGPIVKTYKYDPTKQTGPTPMSAKKR